MAVTKQLSQLEHSAARMTVTLSKDDLRAAYNKRMAELLKECQVPGFRKGHVPQAVLERKMGSAFKVDILNEIIGETTQAIFEENDFPQKFRPLLLRDPELEGAPVLDLDNDLVYAIVFDIMPEVTISACEGLTVEVDEVAITNDDLNRELEKIRDRNAIVIDRNEGEASQKGDIVTVNFCELDNEGKSIGTSKREDFVFEIGTQRNIYRFDDEITGMKAGEERSFEKKYPAEYTIAPHFAGKTIMLKVKTTHIKRKELPALDDDLAQDIDERFKTLDDLKKDVREKMQGFIDTQTIERRNKALLKKINENTNLEIPESFINVDMMDQLKHLAQFGINLETLNEQDSANIRKSSEERVRKSLVTAELNKKYSIEISEEELEKEFEKMSQDSGQTTEESAKAYFEKNPDQLANMQNNLKTQKLFTLLAEKNTIIKGKKLTYLDLFSENV